MRINQAFFGLLFVVCGLLFAGWIGTRVVIDIQYGQNIGGYMKLAAASNTIKLATENMEKVIQEMERRGYTHGYTSLIWTSPSEDVGFWYQNMKASLDELKSVSPTAPLLEQSNVLLKLHETLTAHSKDADVFSPSGVEIFPNNGFFAMWGWGSFGLGILFFLFMLF